MDRSSNDGIYILFTESHEILPNSTIYGMYEIRMNGRINRIYLLKLEFATDGKELINYT